MPFHLIQLNRGGKRDPFQSSRVGPGNGLGEAQGWYICDSLKDVLKLHTRRSEAVVVSGDFVSPDTLDRFNTRYQLRLPGVNKHGTGLMQAVAIIGRTTLHNKLPVPILAVPKHVPMGRYHVFCVTMSSERKNASKFLPASERIGPRGGVGFSIEYRQLEQDEHVVALALNNSRNRLCRLFVVLGRILDVEECYELNKAHALLWHLDLNRRKWKEPDAKKSV